MFASSSANEGLESPLTQLAMFLTVSQICMARAVPMVTKMMMKKKDPVAGLLGFGGFPWL